MNTAQICMIVWMTLGVAIGLLKHGEPKTGNYSFFFSLFDTAILMAMLHYGGFWK